MSAGWRVATPTGIEAAALTRGLPTDVVQVTGWGPAASRQAVHRLADADGLAVAGLAGGLDPRLHAGDVVVATEVRGGDRVVRCPAAAPLAGALRRTGLTVHTGPVLSVPRLVSRRDARAALAADGSLAVDLESAWLVAGRVDPVVVRVVADDAAAAFWRPATLAKVGRALGTLAQIGPVVRQWAAARGPRRVLLPAPRSFCAGVVRAIDVVDRVLDRSGGPVYVRKEIVHNRHVVDRLRQRGAVFVDELDQVPEGAPVVFSAHGVSPAVRVAADERRLSVIDATCPLVSKVHAETRRFADAGQTVLFIGHAGHDETIGTMGERPDHTLLVEDVADARRVCVPDPERVSYLVQTTLAADQVAEIVSVLRSRFPALRGPASDDICYATTNRQRALEAVAAQADLCLVVGSTNSSNSRRLVERAERCGTPAHLLDDAEHLDLTWLAGVRTVALTAGASAPAELIDEVVAALGGLGPVQVEHHELTTETTEFTLPKEIR